MTTKNILIVHAHHEPKSFCSALAQRARAAFERAGHRVDFLDLYAEGFDPVSDRRNFVAAKDPAYLKQQQEESHATKTGGFAPELERHIARLEAADALVFSYPLWWFAMPAILKGWVDRVFANGRVYGGGKWYEKRLGAGKRAMVLMTTGGPPTMYDGFGLNPAMDALLLPVNHGVFWFNGFAPLPSFIAWGPARASDDQRRAWLDQVEARIASFFDIKPIEYLRTDQLDAVYHEAAPRFMVTITRTRPVDDEYKARVPAEIVAVGELKRRGVLLEFNISPPTAANWRGFMVARAADEAALRAELATLPLADWLAFDITPIDKVHFSIPVTM